MNKIYQLILAILLIAPFGCFDNESEKDSKNKYIPVVDVYVLYNGKAVNSITIEKNSTIQLTAKVYPANATNQNVTWVSTNEAVATVSQDGLVTSYDILTNSSTEPVPIIKAISENREFSGDCYLSVNIPVEGIDLDKTSINLELGSTERLIATPVPSDASNSTIIYTSDDLNVATVTSDGTVRGIGVGPATITAETEEGGFTATCDVTVYFTPVTGITLSNTSIRIPKNSSEILNYVILPINATNTDVSISSDDENFSDSNKIVTLDQNEFGIIQIEAKNVGSTTVRVTTDDGNFTAECSVEVYIPVAEVQLNKSETTMEIGSTEQLVIKITPSEATNQEVTWSVDPEGVAEISNTGEITAVGQGSATITVASVDGNKQDTCEVTVFRSVTGVSLNKSTTSLQIGETDQLTATVSPADATNQNVAWLTSDHLVATVSETGEVKAFGVGRATITVRTEDGNYEAHCEVTIQSLLIGELKFNYNVQSITASGDYVYIIDTDSGLMIVDNTSPSSPEVVGTHSLSSGASDIVVEGNYAYIADSDTGLTVMDITDPANPEIEIRLLTDGISSGIAISGNYLYLADNYAGLKIINISNPESPLLENEIETNGYASKVAVDGNTVYVANEQNGLTIVEIVDVQGVPTPILQGNLDTDGETIDVAVSGDYAYLADEEGGLRIVNIVNSSNPTLKVTFDTGGYASGIVLDGNYAYVADANAGLNIIDIETPLSPELITAAPVETNGFAAGVALSGDYICVADGNAGLTTIELVEVANGEEDPVLTPVLIGKSESTGGLAQSVKISGNLAFFADDWFNTDVNTGLTVVDISDTSDPVLLGQFGTDGYVMDVAIDGNYAYIADEDAGIKVVDVSTPSTSLEVVASLDTDGTASGIAVNGDYIYVADGENGLVIIERDLTDPTLLTPVETFDPDGYANKVIIDGDFAYVADGEEGLLIIKILYPLNPELEGFLEVSSNAEYIALDGNYIYLIDSFYGLRIIDVTTKTAPVEKGSISITGTVKEVAIRGNYAYVTDDNVGLNIINITNPLFPELEGLMSLDLNGTETSGVTISGTSAYVAKPGFGLKILDISNF